MATKTVLSIFFYIQLMPDVDNKACDSGLSLPPTHCKTFLTAILYSETQLPLLLQLQKICANSKNCDPNEWIL